jgi:hypothetical protein
MLEEEEKQEDWSRFLLCYELGVLNSVNMLNSDINHQLRAFEENKQNKLSSKKQIKVYIIKFRRTNYIE